VVDEHAGEPVADRLVDQHRGDGGIDAAGKAADHPALRPDLAADFRDRLVLEGAHGPIAGRARDGAHEVAQECGAVRGVHHLEVKLRRVEAPRLVGDHRDRRVGRGRDDAEARRRRGHAVAVAHPHGVFLAALPYAGHQRALRRHLDLGAAELAVVAALDLAAELVGHRLLAVADAEDRHAGGIEFRRRQRRAGIEHRGGPA
jgi:hypothetical protein